MTRISLAVVWEVTVPFSSENTIKSSRYSFYLSLKVFYKQTQTVKSVTTLFIAKHFDTTAKKKKTHFRTQTWELGKMLNKLNYV